MKVLSKNKKEILLGNECVVRGALESGLGFASTYPGTPASEIGDTFSHISKKAGFYFEYSTNEKIALEVATGAALSGIKSMVSFKHFGLNVASDSLMPIAYIGTPLVIAMADDPNCWSSAQSEQDSRYYSRLAHIPMLEPSSPEEAKEFTKLAFDIAWKYSSPVIVRLTTRVSHTRGIVRFGKIKKGKTKGRFKKDLKRYNNLPPHTMRMHLEILDKIEKIRKFSENTKINYIINNKKSDVGIIVSGVSFNYVMEALTDLNIKLPVLKLGLTYPLPEKKIDNFIKRFKKVLVVEELEPILEQDIKRLAKDANPKLKVYGKDLLPKAGEYKEEKLICALEKLTKARCRINVARHMKKYEKLVIPRRIPVLCYKCQYRPLFSTLHEIAPDAIYGGDIGCYILGIYPPYYVQDFCISMGASEGITHGINKATGQKTIAIIGDSTFFHAGIPALINTVYNKSNSIIIILDNRITAMTGHQPHPGSEFTSTWDKHTPLSIEKIVKACGVKNVRVIDPIDTKQVKDTVKAFMKNKEVSVIIAKRQCWLFGEKMKRRKR